MADDDPVRPRPEAESGGGQPGNGSDGPQRPANPRDAADEVEKLRAELTAANDRALRERADLENLKKRVTREKAEALRFANESLLRELLPVIDNLNRALEHARNARADDPIVQGVDLVLRSLVDVLGRHGVKIVEARGTRFDPNVHEAIGHVESEQPPNTVIDEHQRGYLLHDRLLRPALVTVGKGRTADRPGVERPDNDD
jgi:molecular chaperone GrpE